VKFASFRLQGRATWGLVEGASLLDVGAELGSSYPDLRTYLASGSTTVATEAASSAAQYPFDVVEWLSPIPNPKKILCVGLNYETHRLETGRAESQYPAMFSRFADTLLGHRTDLLRPQNSNQLDYEGELAVVIGRSAHHIGRAEARAYIGGYMCFNDATLRDWQRHTHQFTPGKNFPGTGACGPWLVTPDEIDEIEQSQLTTRLNGVVVQQAYIRQMIFSIPELIEYCSAFTPLNPGDIIATGTPGGVGFKKTPPSFLGPADTVEVEIDGVGVLTNGVRDEIC
jgi:2-keto-4-pentenoate hydratase/2-oxohepta-3-ene-1,7-dioic acid hydratase in catechol pathway